MKNMLHFNMRRYTQLVGYSWIICLCLQGVIADLCQDYSGQPLADLVHEHSTPRGGVHAGNYGKDSDATTLPACLMSCCADDTCNTMLFHDGVCYLIQCNTSVPDACEPEPRKGKKFENTYMINIRTLDETAASLDDEKLTTHSDSYPDTESQFESLLSNVEIKNECSLTEPVHDGCQDNEECKLVVTDDLIGSQCHCVRGYTRDEVSGKCAEATSGYSSTKGTSERPLDQACTYGIVEECFENEECVVHSSRARTGSCECLEGLTRDEDGWCEDDEDFTRIFGTSTFDSETKKSKSTLPVVETSTTKAATSMKTTTLSTKTITTTTTTSTTSTTTPVPSTSTSAYGAAAVANATKKQVVVAANVTASNITGLIPLTVSAGDHKELQLPVNEVTLSAFALPAAEKDEEYKYEWSLILHPEGDQVGQMVGINTAKLKLSDLIAGEYTFKVTVSAEGKFGEAFVNVTVKPPTRKNSSPVAVINPTKQQVSQPNDVVLDGSQSTDDDQIVSYHWEQVSGPVNDLKIADSEMTKAMIQLKGLSPGEYRFKLTVKDSDEVENSTFSNVTVMKETDYPPKANAGSNVITSLPHNSLTLYGNASTDDKGIVSYEWIKNAEDKLTADMTGVRTAFLHLENLEVGDYTFTLKVTDSAGQVSTADVHVFVKAEQNKPPAANAGRDKKLLLPTDVTTLDGSNSTDDQSISTYHWSQVSGPGTTSIENADRSVATVSKLKAGEYKFKLVVIDNEGLEGSDTVTINVKENENHAPVANAGGDQVVDLPINLVTLDGSMSTDDRGIVSYTWKRNDKSLAAGRILNNSDHQAILQLSDLVLGRYIFTLEVVDAEGLSSSNTASVIVKPNIHENDLVQLYLAADITTFTEANKNNLQEQLALLIHRTLKEEDIKVTVTDLEQDKTTGSLVVTLYASIEGKDLHMIQPGTAVVNALKKKIRADKEVLDFSVVWVDTLVCQNNCSLHGHCDQSTKQCICEAFWMQNIIKAYVLGGESNCEWSILYVIIIAFVIVIALAGVVWGTVCLCRRWYKWRPKKRHRYTLLKEMEDDKEAVEMIPRGKIQNSSLMVSESDFSSDEETLFVNHKKTNGHAKPINGMVKNSKTKVKT